MEKSWGLALSEASRGHWWRYSYSYSFSYSGAPTIEEVTEKSWVYYVAESDSLKRSQRPPLKMQQLEMRGPNLYGRQQLWGELGLSVREKLCLLEMTELQKRSPLWTQTSDTEHVSKPGFISIWCDCPAVFCFPSWSKNVWSFFLLLFNFTGAHSWDLEYLKETELL